MLEYKSPTSLDMPEIFTDLIEHPDPQGPFGAKEVGQGPLLPIMPAVANAVYDAVGVRVDQIPMTPEKILRALQAKAAGKPARSDPASFPDIAWPEPLLVTPPHGGRRRSCVQRTGAPLEAQGRSGHRSNGRRTIMMRLPGFRYRSPRTIADAAAWLADDPAQSMLLAGGTDLLPNMKRRQQTPATLIGLRRIDSFADIRQANGLTIGAGVTLSSLTADPRIRQSYPGLWQAAAQIATPHLRNMGTIGGNLCLDTRCTYYDQNYEWRKSIDFCMKKDGATCWVATSSPKCLAVSSTDTAPMLQALGASVTLVSAHGHRILPVVDLFANDGMHYLTKRPDEILTTIDLPAPDGWSSSYWKLRRRGAFDFPVAAAAVAVRRDGETVVDVRIVLGAVASRPLEASRAAAILMGQRLTDEAIAAAAVSASEVAKPMDNTDFELVWRKKMVRSLVENALREVRGDDMRARRHQLARQELLSVARA